MGNIVNSNQPKHPTWDRIVRINSSGAGSAIMLLIGLAVGFAWGYHTKYKSYKASGAQIVNQSLNNKKLDFVTSSDMSKRDKELHDALTELGYDSSEIKFLLKGDVNALDKLKAKIRSYTRSGELYPPRPDCSDDYLGQEASEKTNQQILERFNRVRDD